MKTAEEHYREAQRAFNKHLFDSDLPFDDAKERELTIEEMKKYAEAAVRQDRENLKKNCIVNCEGSSMALCFDSQPLPDLK